MRTDEFDAQVKNEFDHNDFEYDPGHWDKINMQLHGRKNKALFILKPAHGIAAGIALLCATAILYTTFKKPAAVVTITPAQHSRPVAQTNTAAAARSVTTAPATPAMAKQPIKPHGAAIALTAPAKRPAHQAAYSHSSGIVATVEDAAPNNNESLTDPNSANSIVARHTQEVKTEVNAGKTPAVKSLPPHSTTLYAANDEQEKKSKKISLNLTGGLNYGSANAGYAVGGNAMASISRKFYVEGDIAFVNGSRTTTTANYYNAGGNIGPNNNFSTSAVTAPVYESINHSRATNYLQFAPALGYQVFKNVSIGVGADIERLLDYSAVTEATPSGDMKVLPEIDFGLTAKTEYRLNKRLKAGLQYREGINNALGGTGKYVDRNYFQVQVKFNILER